MEVTHKEYLHIIRYIPKPSVFLTSINLSSFSSLGSFKSTKLTLKS